MNNTAEIKRRLASVKQTRQITGAMETISIAKMRKSTELVERNKPYFTALTEIAGNIARSSDGESVYFKSKCDKSLYIVIAADRGLCGGFNHDIFKAASVIGDNDVLSIGYAACDYYKSRNISDKSISSGNVDYAKASELGRYVLSLYGERYGAVYIVYTDMKNKSVYAPCVKKILPLEKPVDKSTTAGKLSFEPSADEVMEKFMPVYISGVLYGALLNSAASEHLARHAAMSASAKNADEMIALLSAELNNVRQSLVTEQITEIIGSTRALKGDRL